jgi:hypothetical protein
MLDTIGKLFEKILLTMILYEVSGGGLLRGGQFGFRPKHSTVPQLTRLVEKVSRNFDERKLTGTVFLDVAKAFTTVWVYGLLYKLKILKFLSILLKPYHLTFRAATSTVRRMRAGVAQGGIISHVLLSL